MERRLREYRKYAFDNDDGWSSWKRAVVPRQNVKGIGKFDDRGVGLISRNLSQKNPFGDDGDCRFGLFELEARRPRNRLVVFLGRPESDKSLHHQSLAVCTESRQKDLIDNAVELGYELWVRIKPLESAQEEEKEWQDILDEYDYAWNDQREGPVREKLLLEETDEYQRQDVVWLAFYCGVLILGWINVIGMVGVFALWFLMIIPTIGSCATVLGWFVGILGMLIFALVFVPCLSVIIWIKTVSGKSVGTLTLFALVKIFLRFAIRWLPIPSYASQLLTDLIDYL